MTLNQLRELTELIEPPHRPLKCSDLGNWDKLVEAIDFPFPNEFREYGRLYGTGEIAAGGYGLLIGNPLDPKFPKWVQEQSQAMRTRGDGPDRRPRRFYPEPNGIVPFASDWSGGLAFLTRDGKVASCPGDPNELISYQHGFVDFLVAMFSADLSPEWFPNKVLRRHRPEFKKLAWL